MQTRAVSTAAGRRGGSHSLSRQALERAVARTIETLEARRMLASVFTDKLDYGWGQTAHITGTEFAPNEPVQLQVTHVEGTVGSNEDPENAPWLVEADAEGNVSTTWSVTDPDAIAATYLLTARGLTSGLEATTIFTDAREINSVTLNGGTSTLIVAPGASITAAVNVTTDGSGSAARWRSTGWRIATAPGAMTIVDHVNHDGAANYLETFSITAPTAPGTYNAYFIAYDNDAGTGGPSPTFTLAAVIIVDDGAPSVTSINRAGASPTNAAAVTYNVNFNENVTGVDASDFALTTTGGISGASIQSVSGSGSAYTVVVNTGAGDGTLRLDLIDDDSISDVAGNDLGGTGAGNGNLLGQVYTIDKTAPTVTIDQAAGQGDLTNASPVNFTVVFSEPVSGFTASDVIIGGAANPTAVNVTGSGTTYNVAVSGMTAVGTVTASIVANAAQDSAGNLSAASSSTDNSVFYDAVAPAAPVITHYVSDTGISGDNITSDQTLDFTGTAEANSTVQIYDGLTLLGGVVADGDGNWSFSTGTLGGGAHSFTAKAIDAAGNVSPASAALNITIDFTPPAAPSTPDLAAASDSGSSSSDNLTNINAPTFTGTAEAGSTVTIYADGIAVGSGVATAGSYSIIVSALGNGSHDITATATDAAGNVGALSGTLNITIDAIAPAAPSTPDLVALSDTGTSDSDDLTSLPTPTFTGTAETGSIVKLYSDGVLVGQATAVDGTWTVTSSALTSGTRLITATATDAAGNVSPASAALSIVVDLTAPAAPAITGITTDTGASSTDRVTSDQTLVLHGTAEANALVTVTRVGAGVVGATTADAGGNWSFDYTGTTLGSGNHSFTATARDAAGNTSANSSTFTVTIDVAAPAAPAISGIVSDTGTSSSDGITSDASLILSGTAEANALVTLFRDGVQIGTTSANGAGAWSFDYTATTLGEGAYAFTAHATDAAGNVSSLSSTFNVTIDTSAPNAPAVTGITTDTGILNTDGITNDTTLIIHGAAEAHSIVTVFRNGTNIGTTTATAGGTWSFDATGTSLSGGTYTFTATARDAAGNISPTSGAFTVVIDLTAPAAPVVNSIVTDTGSSSTDRVTSDQTLVIGGTAEANSVVTVFRNGSPIGTTFASGTGTWSFDYTGTTLAEGAYSFTATATDLAGNTSATSTAINVTIDITAPAAPIISSFATDSGTLGDAITNDNTLVLNGTSEANAVINIFDGATLIGATTAGSGGAWSFNTAVLSDGSHSFTATAADAAGNTSAASSAMVVVIDTAAPAAPPQVDLDMTSDTGGSQTDNVTFVRTPLFTGTAEPLSTVTVYDNGSALGTTTADASGNWSFLTPDNKALSSNPGGVTHSITARATDAAGNLSAASPALNITVADQTKIGAVAITNQAPKPVNPGGIAAFDLTLTRGDQKNSGGTLNIDLSINWTGGVPTGVSVLGPIGSHAVTLRSQQPVTTVIFRVATSASTPIGIYPFTITASASAGSVIGQGVLVVGFGPDLAPNANNDVASTAKNTPVNINVLANDLAGPFASPFAISGFTSGANGIVQNLGGGILKYTPVTNFVGTDTFTYTITDENGFSDSALVTVHVDAGNVAPIATTDSYTTNENTPLVIAAPGVLANDSDPNGDSLVARLDPSGGPFNGTLNLNLNGSFTYTPNAGFNGTDSFIYYADDGTFASNEVIVTITFGAINDAPVNTLPGPQTTSEDTTLVLSTANGNAISISDIDAGTENVSVTLGVTNGTLVLSTTAGLTFNAGSNSSASMTVTGAIAAINAALDGLSYVPTANFHGVATLTITTNDLGHTGSGGALSDTDTLSINVTPANDAPTADPQSISTGQNTSTLITLTGSDIENTPLAFIVTALPSHGSLYDDGYLITPADLIGGGYTLTGADVTYVPDANYFGIDAFNFVSTDGDLDSAPAAISITVLDTTPPVINLSGSVGNELDADTQSFTWSVTDASGLSDVSVNITKNGVSIFSTTAASGTFNFDSEGLGDFEIAVSATDNAGNTANASRAVSVSDDDTDAPSIVINGSSGAELDSQAQSFTWAVTDASGLSALSVVVTRDGVPVYSTSNLADASGTFNFDSFGLGNFQISISATDADDDRANDTILATASQSVTVTDDDTTGPAIILTGSENAENDGQPQSFSWNISDPSGLSAISVIVRHNGDIVYQTNDLADAIGTFDFDALGLGAFTIEVEATDNDADHSADTAASTASRSVTVTDDDNTPPAVTLGGSQNTELDSQNQVFTWNVTDASGLLGVVVTVRKNGDVIHTSEDAAGSFDFNGYGIGTFDIVVAAVDADDDRAGDARSSFATRSVTVSDDDTAAPIITLGGSQGAETDGDTNHFTWSISDAGSGLGSISVIIRKDGDMIYQTNDLADATGSFNFDTLGLGEYTIEVEATDADGDWTGDAVTSTASRSVTVTDDDTDAPVITLGGSEDAETDAQNQVFTWNVTDASTPLTVSVTITRNGDVIHTSTDPSGSFDFNSHGLGVYEINVTATDADSDRALDSLTTLASRSVTVTDDDTAAPIITLDGSTGSETDGQPQSFSWTITDAGSGLGSILVTIRKDGDIIHQTSDLADAIGSFNFDTLGLGTYTIEIEATDADGDRADDTLTSTASRTVVVSDDDTAAPVIALGGSEGAETDGDTNHFTWNASDAGAGLGSINLVITRDDGAGPVVIYSTTTTADAIGSFNFDTLGLGTYQINLSATDADADRSDDALTATATRTVVVTDDDTAAPVITLGGSEGTEHDGENQHFTWNVLDSVSGLATTLVTITKNGDTIHTSTAAAGSFEFNSFGLGDYQITVTATDADDDRADDSLTALASQSVTVTDDDITGPAIILSGSENTENDGETQSFSWNISDAGSGLGSILVTIRKDGDIIHQTSDLADAAGSFNFDWYGLGTFTIEVSATDADGDRADDALTSTATRTVVVSDDDVDAPAITLGGSELSEDDGQNQIFTWNITDASGLGAINVVITHNGDIIYTSTDAAGSFDFNSYGLGTFAISVTATDADDDRADDSLTALASRSVTVSDDDTTSPTIVLGGSEGSETDGDTNAFHWTISDVGSGLGSLLVTIRKDGDIIHQTSDLADATGSFNFDSYGLGTFTVEVSATDADSDRADDALTSNASRTVVISDDDIVAPVITLGGSELAENDGQDQLFTWDVSDLSGLNGVTVTITQNGDVIHTSTDASGSFDFNTFGLGTFEITVAATDADDDRADDALTALATRSVIVSDDDTTSPTITLGGSDGSETDGATNHFTWNISDAGSGLGSILVTIRKDGEIIHQTSDLANATGSFNFDALGLGAYTIDIEATDADADRADDARTSTASRTVIVSDDDVAAPSITLGGSQNEELDGQQQVFTWNVTDPSGLSNVTVTIRKDGDIIHTSSAAGGSFDFDAYGLGTFTIEVSATDNDADRADDNLTSTATRSVTVIDDDIDAPVIVLGGSEGVETDGQTNYFTWNVSDSGAGIGELSVIIRRNGEVIYETNDLVNVVGSFNFDAYGLGSYTIHVVAVDADGDRSEDSLSSADSRVDVVEDDDVEAPVILLDGSTGTETDGQNQNFIWNISDFSGLGSISVVITRNGDVIHTSTDASGSFDFNSHGLGNYAINVIATDADSDRADDALTALASRSVTVTDDDVTGPTIVLGGSTGSETDDLPQTFTWNISDPSGLSAISVIVRHDGDIVYQTSDLADAIGSFDFNTLGLGNFTIEVFAIDNDGDRADDTSTSTASRSVNVTDDDTSAPVIIIGGSGVSETDGETNHFTWNISDASGLSAINVIITRNGDEIFSTTDLTDAIGSFNFDSYGPGEYAISITATDADSDRPSDTLTNTAGASTIVTDDDTAAPVITLGGSENSETDGEHQHFTWNVADASGLGGVTVTIAKNGDVIHTSSDAAGSFNFNSYGLGVFEITVVATDADSDHAADALTSTASRSVTVTDDDTTSPLIVLGGSEASETDGATNVFTWSISDTGSGLGSISVVIRRNGDIIYETTDLANATGSYNFDAHGLGTYTIDVTATDADSDRSDDALTSTASRAVAVSDDDTTAPTITLGGSENIENDGEHQHFTWNVDDASGLSSVIITITKNGSVVHTSTDAAGSFDFNALGLGTYEIAVSATDADNDHAADQLTSAATRTVTVTDDDVTPPAITLGGSTGSETDGDTNHFTWDILDLGSGLDNFLVEITRNGDVIYSTTTLAAGSFNFDTFGLGEYAINVTATDNDHDWTGDTLTSSASRSVNVSDDDITPPTILLGGSELAETDAANQHFTWNVTDVSGLDAVSVVITRNGDVIHTSIDATGSFDFNSFGLGTYEINVTATDADGDRADDALTASALRSVVVTDDDTAAPIITLGGSVNPEHDGQTQVFSWNINDAGSGLGSFLVTITRNGAGIFSTNSQPSGSFNFDAFGLGLYVISVTATDGDTDWAGDQLSSSDSNWVMVSDDDTTAPTINLGGSQGAETDGDDQHFTWNVSDASGLSDVLVTIRRNGSAIQSFTTASGSFDFNSLGVGEYDITVSAADNDDDWTGDISSTSATRSVTVSDDDTAGPVINLGGSSGEETDHVTNAFTWNISDPSGLSAVSITITKNGNVIHTSTDPAGVFAFDTFGPGNYEIGVSATDNDYDWDGDRSSSLASRSVVVSDDDTAAPIITTGGSTGAETDAAHQHFTWDITDASGLSNMLVTVTRNGVPIFTSIDASGSFDFNSHGLGNYEMTVSATDADTDWTGDQLSNSVTRSVTVSDDDTAGPTINVGGSTGTQLDGQDQKFTWNVSDASGLSDVLITITKDGNTVFTTTDPNVEFDFNSLGLGTFKIVILATDADTDYAGDQSSSGFSRTVVVNDDDTAAPVITLGGSNVAETDAAHQHFTWNVADFSGIDSLLVTVTRNGTEIFTSAAPSGSFDFNSFGLGDYQITVTATDADTDWAGDQMTASASRSVTVSDDDTTVPTIILGGSEGSESDGADNHFTWSVSDGSNLSSLLVTIKRNGEIVHQTNALADVSGSFNFNALGLGDYEMTVSATDADNDWLGDASSNLATRTVTVTDDDTTAPHIAITGSNGAESDGQNQFFAWNVTDASGLSDVLVTISRNGSPVQTFTNASGSFDFNTLGLGTFDITVSATDADSDRDDDALTAFASQTVTVTDDDTAAPIIVIGGSQGSETDGDLNHFTWSISDAGSGLGSILVTIRRNGDIIRQTSDLADAIGSFNFDPHGLGTYTIDIEATDADSDRADDAMTSTASRSVVVTDDDITAPSITLGGSTGAETDGQTNAFTWNVADLSGLHSVNVVITQDGNVIHTSSDAAGSFNFDNYGLGEFQISVTAVDADDDRADDRLTSADTRNVAVSDDDTTAPTIVLGGSENAEHDDQHQHFTWSVSDISGLSDVTITIRKNGDIVQTFNTADGSFDFNTLGLGTFTIEVSATDNDSDRANDTETSVASRTVTVSDDDTTGPTITLGGSQGTQTDGEEQLFTWNVTDPSGLSAVNVTITRNGDVIDTSTEAAGVFAFDTFGLGDFEIHVIATDADGDRADDTSTSSASRSVTVLDDDITAPIITLGGSQGLEHDGQAQSFNWNVSDPSGISSMLVEIKRNGATIFTGNSNGSFDFDSYGVGAYELIVTATDADGDRADDSLADTQTRTVIVSDDDITPPQIILSGSSGSENDGQDQQFTWNVSDVSGLSAVNVTISRNGGVIHTSTDAAGGFDFNAHGLGTYEIHVAATDNDNDWSGDQLSTSATRSVTVSDDDITAPMIVLGGSQGAEHDGLNQHFTWDVSDASGIGSVLVTITHDGNVVQSFTTTSGSFDFNTLGLGTFEITVTATDADNDRADDAETSTASRTVTVTDDDTTGPSIALGGSNGSESHGLTQSFNWNVSDVSGLGDVIVTVRKNGSVIYSGSSASGNFNFDAHGLGTFVIEVAATDADNDRANDTTSNSASRQVIVTNANPIADAGADKEVNEGASVTFNAGGSSDADGDTLAFTWTFGDGSTGVGLAPVHIYADNGDYTVTLTVNDGWGGITTDTMSVRVNNVAPSAQIAGITAQDEGSLLALTSSFTDPGADTHTYNWKVVADNGQFITDGAGTTFSFTPNDDGKYTITLTVTDDDGGIGTAVHTVFVSNVAPIASSAAATGLAARQYSDFIMPINVVGIDPSDVDVLSAQIISGLPANSGLSVAFDSVTRSGAIVGKANLAPGTYNVTVRISDDDGGWDDITVPLVVTQEDAVATYSGTNFMLTAANSSLATIALRATIHDITAAAPGLDPDAGDIRNARVTFINRDTNTVIAANLPVTLLDPSDPKSGVASYNWNVDLGSAVSQSYTVGIIVSNYYARDAAVDNTVITVSRPLGGFITGGGYFVNTSSGGLLAGEAGERTNFGFNVKYNKSMTSLQGNVNIIVRSYRLPDGTLDNKLHVYQIKSNAISWLATETDPITGKRYAMFQAKANVQDITNPRNVISIAGGLTLEMKLTDGGEGLGATDSIGFTVTRGNELWYSSNWDGSKTVEELLGGGNVQVYTADGGKK